MKPTELIDKLKSIRKTYLSFNDIAKAYNGDRDELKVVLNRLVKQGRIKRIMKGYYAFNISLIDWEQFACEVLRPSYISLEYALWRYGIIDQIPTRITLITIKKSREFILENQVLEYTHIKPELYFGYEIYGNYLMAKKEKAILDEIYLICRGKRHLNLNEANLNDVDLNLLTEWAEKFPEYVGRFIRDFVL